MTEHWLPDENTNAIKKPRPNPIQIRERSRVSKWLRELHDCELHDLFVMLYKEGLKRGFGTYWTE